LDVTEQSKEFADTDANIREEAVSTFQSMIQNTRTEMILGVLISTGTWYVCANVHNLFLGSVFKPNQKTFTFGAARNHGFLSLRSSLFDTVENHLEWPLHAAMAGCAHGLGMLIYRHVTEHHKV